VFVTAPELIAGVALDLAIGGSGFFAVQAADGSTRYTRDGGFHTDPDGSLRARDGSAVLDTNGQTFTLPTGADVSVAADGTVLANGTSAAAATLQRRISDAFARGREAVALIKLQSPDRGARLAERRMDPETRKYLLSQRDEFWKALQALIEDEDYLDLARAGFDPAIERAAVRLAGLAASANLAISPAAIGLILAIALLETDPLQQRLKALAMVAAPFQAVVIALNFGALRTATLMLARPRRDGALSNTALRAHACWNNGTAKGIAEWPAAQNNPVVVPLRPIPELPAGQDVSHSVVFERTANRVCQCHCLAVGECTRCQHRIRPLQVTDGRPRAIKVHGWSYARTQGHRGADEASGTLGITCLLGQQRETLQ